MACCGCWWTGRQRHRPPESPTAGNPRNKCALQPGHSLMDWIRLGNSGKDLTGVGGRIRPVSLKELSAHNTQSDAWLAIRGRVYNVTHYLPYHPGGPEELMRGAGIDATQLFDKVHPWVNYDSLLAKCLVGPLRHDLPDAEELFGPPNSSPKPDRLREPSKAQELVRKSMENLANCITPIKKKSSTKSDDNSRASPPSKIMQSLLQSSDLPVSISRRAGALQGKTNSVEDGPAPLRFDWIQTSTKLTMSVYTGFLGNPGGSVRIVDGVLFVEIVTDDWLRTLKLVPEAKLLETIQMKMYIESGKIEVIVQKAIPEVWKSCGEANSADAIRISSPRSLECCVRLLSTVSQDTTLIHLEPTVKVFVPLGHHIRVHHTVDGSENVRSYTPVGDGWDSSNPGSVTLKLAVKRYEQGVTSKYLTSLKEEDKITVSGPYGNFKLQKLKSVRKIFLIAAGTGITPMLGLIKFMLSRTNPRCERAHLLFYNKTEKDILFRENFDEIAKNDSRFITTHVLTDSSTTLGELRGRINTDHLKIVFNKDIECKEYCDHFVCVCGPTDFTQTTTEFLNQIGYNDMCLHAFMG